MDWLQALILGIIQGLTEFLPVSSSGHLELAKAFFGIQSNETLIFTVVVHGATVLSTIVVFWNDIKNLFKSFFTFQWNDDNKYIAKLLISAIPVLIVGLFFKDQVENLFTGNIILVGSMLLITGLLLTYAHFSKPKDKQISFLDAFIIGIAQAIAVLPGISRSGATISTALILGNKKEEATKFSFLMVLIPIIGANLLELFDFFKNKPVGETQATISAFTLLVGFLAAFLTGLFACKLMIKIVKNSKLIYFAIYCFIIGSLAIGYYFFLN